MSKRKKINRGRHVEHKKVRVNETGQIFETYAEAARAINGHKGDILLCLTGHRQRHKGYSFSYVDEHL